MAENWQDSKNILDLEGRSRGKQFTGIFIGEIYKCYAVWYT